MRKQRGQSALEFALMVPMIFLLIFGCIYGGIMFIHFMNYSNEARRIARDIAVQVDSTKRAELVTKYNGVAANSDEETLGGIYKVTLKTQLLMTVEKTDADGNTIKDANGKPITKLDPITNESDYSKAEEVHVRFDFYHGEDENNLKDFPFGFPPSSFAASYHMVLENN